jgi:23S rRNA (cytosine1962-C5)-methyltransferase
VSTPQLWQPEQYQLLDFGNARKLERFGGLLLDRPSPAAQRKRPSAPELWERANARIADDDVPDAVAPSLPADWRVNFKSVTFQLRLTPFGHVGLFPEHAVNWQWLADRFAHESPGRRGSPLRLLNLFAYTGGATLHLASRDWEVVHVDAAAPSVAWARHNVQLSQLSNAPIRWIVDDARAFVAREVRRGSRYDAILLDPPTYGHGPKGKAWQIDRDLEPLLCDCAHLLAPGSGCLVLTGHSEGLDGASVDLPAMLAGEFERTARTECGRLSITDTSGRALDCGWFVRCDFE